MTSRSLGRGFPLFPILLIALGGLLLLQTTGVLSWNLWGSIWRLWPVLIIAVGIDIVLGARMPWIAGILIAVALAVGIALAAFSGAFVNNGFSNDLVATITMNEPLGETESVDVQIDFVAGELTLESLPTESANLVEAEFHGRHADVSVDRSGGSAKLNISVQGSGLDFLRYNYDPRWNVFLSPSPAMSIDLDAGASEMNLNLLDLKVQDLSIDAGATDIEITMPAAAGHVNADIDLGAADLLIIIPEGVGARIDADAAVGSLSIDRGRFPKQGDIYLSPDFEVLANKINLTIDSGASSIEIR